MVWPVYVYVRFFESLLSWAYKEVLELRVMHLLNSSFYSRAEYVLFQTLALFKNIYIEMYYCSIDGDIRNNLNEKRYKNYWVNELSFFEIKKAIHDIKHDVIHAHDMKAAFIASFCCKKAPFNLPCS